MALVTSCDRFPYNVLYLLNSAFHSMSILPVDIAANTRMAFHAVSGVLPLWEHAYLSQPSNNSVACRTYGLLNLKASTESDSTDSHREHVTFDRRGFLSGSLVKETIRFSYFNLTNRDSRWVEQIGENSRCLTS